MGRLAELVPWDALGTQSLPGKGRAGCGSWERNRCIPCIHLVLSIGQPQGTKGPQQLRKELKFLDKGTQVNEADSKALRSQESIHERRVSREQQRGRGEDSTS